MVGSGKRGANGSRLISTGDRDVELGNPDKILFPRIGATKSDLADYFRRIADVVLPHLHDRPMTFERYPDGIDADGFFQKDTPDHFPEWIARAKLPKQGGTISYTLVEDAATLIYLADQACITLHAGLSRIDRPDVPDRLVFDLDPSVDDFARVRRAARCTGRLLDELGLKSFVQTTGSRGLHVVVPLRREAGFDATREFARRVGAVLEARHPGEMTTAQRKEKRGEAVFVDYLRNAYGQTAVVPYAVRAKPGAPIATPIDWKELGNGSLRPQRYSIRNIFRRLAHKRDPWVDISRQPQTLSGPSRKLAAIEAS